MDVTLTATTTPDLSGPRSKSHEGVSLSTLQNLETQASQSKMVDLVNTAKMVDLVNTLILVDKRDTIEDISG